MLSFPALTDTLSAVEISCDRSGCDATAEFTGRTPALARMEALNAGWALSRAVTRSDERPTRIGDLCPECARGQP